MTSAAGITPSTGAPPAGSSSKQPTSRTDDEESGDLPELPMFADFFPDLENQELPPERGTTPQAEQRHQQSPDREKASLQGREDAALQVEATHSEWFGGDADASETETETVLKRKPVLTIRPSESAPETNSDGPGVENDSVPIPPAIAEELRLGSAGPENRSAALSADVGPYAQPVPQKTIAELGVKPDGSPDQASANREQTQPPPASQGGSPSSTATPQTPAPSWPVASPQQFASHERAPTASSQQPTPAEVARAAASSVMAAAAAPPPPRADRPAAPASRTLDARNAEAAMRSWSSAPASRTNATSANLNASLSALEAMLTRENGPSGNTGKTPGTEGGSAQQALREANITSVRQETHLGHAAAQTPNLQIAQRVAHEMQTIARSPDPASPQSQSQKAPMRVLHIQLNPPDLGPLTIRMSMRNEALVLQLETGKIETARLIHQDREALSGLLRSAGYSLDSLNIQVMTPERGAGGQSSSAGDNSGQTNNQQESRDAGSRSANRDGRGDPHGQGTGAGGRQHGGHSARSRNGYYL